MRHLRSSLYALALITAALLLVLGQSAHVGAQSTAATLTYPPNGATNVDMSLPIQWTSVSNVQAYYLYVGTTAGAKDLVDTGEILNTSFLAPSLPTGQTLYASMWTKTGGAWRYVDSTFTAASFATLTYPANGAVNVDVTQPVKWTTVYNAQAYYLYVGTTLGAKNLVDSGEWHQTSYLAVGLPLGQTVYARIWTKAGGIWKYADSTFSTSALPGVRAIITYPPNGASNADLQQPIQWTSVPSIQAYYLYVGTSVGAKNLINSYEIQRTWYSAAGLPAWQTLYARMWAKVASVWRYTDSTFSFQPTPATLTYPPNGAVNVDQTAPATWTTAADAQAYYLYVGTSPGANDLINSGEIASTSYSIEGLPIGQTVYARLHTKVAGVWLHRDTTFSAAAIAPEFEYPTDGAIGVDGGQPIRWKALAAADAHQLRVGTSPGGNQILDTGDITAASVQVSGLPASGAVYARVLSRVHGIWHHKDIAFTLEGAVATSTVIRPAAGDSAFDTARPFEWQPVPLARGYRLLIGSAPLGSNLHDSGEIQVTRRFVPNLPLGRLFGRLQTKIDGQWYSYDFAFTVTANTTSVPLQIESATWATDIVRSMALSDNRAFSWTELAPAAATRVYAVCSDYADTLRTVLSEMNLQLSTRKLNLSFNPNRYDVHTLVDIYNSDTGGWMLLDPTFDLTAKRASDGGWASAEDVSNATRNQQWSAITYVPLGTQGDAFARSYYLDYPLLYLNVYHDGLTGTNGQGGTVLPYLVETQTLSSATPKPWAAGCSASQTTVLRVDGTDRAIDCSGVDGISPIFIASSIARTSQTDATVRIYQPRRFVF